MKKLTVKYWNSLDNGSRKRALTYVFPLHKGIVDMLLNEKPDKNEPFWELVFKKVKNPEDSFYKTCVNGTYIP